MNRDRDNDHVVKLRFANAEGAQNVFFSGPVDQITLGESQYQWHLGGWMGTADPDGPPQKSTVSASADALYQLPKASLTILRGNIKAGAK